MQLVHICENSTLEGYWCVICQKFLQKDEDGIIIHEDVEHPLLMDFCDDHHPQ